jgi:hypothetical protein
MPKMFSETVAMLADGEFDARTTKLLNELTAAVEATGGTGKLTVTFKLDKQNRMVVVRAVPKIVRPEPAVDDTMFFVDEDDGLVREDPKQTRIPGTERGLRPVAFPPRKDKD